MENAISDRHMERAPDNSNICQYAVPVEYWNICYWFLGIRKSFNGIHLWGSLAFTWLIAQLVWDRLFLKPEWTIVHGGELKQ